MKFGWVVYWSYLMAMIALPVQAVAQVPETSPQDTLRQIKKQERKFTTMLYSSFGTTDRSSAEREIAKRDRAYYNQFEGRTVGNIQIYRNNAFDTDSSTRLERLGNSFHRTSLERTIARDLLFKSGDPFDAQLLMSNRRLIRERNYITDVNVLVIPQQGDSTVVDLYYFTKDKWTTSLDASFNGDGKSFIEVYDQNLAGWGNRLSVRTYFDWKHQFNYGGNMVEYEIPNIWGTFFSSRFVAGKGFDHAKYGVELNKEFVRRTDYAGGATVLYEQDPIRLFPLDTTHISSWRQLEVWGGFSRELKDSKNSSLYLTGRIFNINYTKRPEVTTTLNPYFHNKSMVLTEIGIYRERFRRANLIYGYGVTEYIAYGYRMGLTSGYSWGEFGNRWYLGGAFHAGGFTSFGYIGGNVELGSYLNHYDGKFYRTSLITRINYFSNQLGSGQYPMRQFLSLNVTRGWNRLDGYGEQVGFREDNQAHGLRGMSERVYGQNRAIVNTETVFFTPWQLYQFRFAMFAFCDMGLIGDNGNIFRNPFYATLGIGARIKNERLIFSTINIRLGVALNRNGFMNNDFFNISSADRLNPIRYTPMKPEPVDYQ